MTTISREIFRGRIVTLTQETVRLPDGHQFELEVVHHPGGAAVLALDEQQRLCLIRQYRHVTGGWLWEVPAGKIDNHEPPEQAARRELQEEAGVTAQQLHYLGRTVTSPGIFTEVVHLFLATQLRSVTAAPEPEETIEVHWLPLAAVYDMIARGEIIDAKTIVGMMQLQLYQQGQTQRDS